MGINPYRLIHLHVTTPPAEALAKRVQSVHHEGVTVAGDMILPTLPTQFGTHIDCGPIGALVLHFLLQSQPISSRNMANIGHRRQFYSSQCFA